MEAVVPAIGIVSPLVKVVVSKLSALLQKKSELLDGLEGDIISITGELGMIVAETEDHLSQNRNPSSVQIQSMEEMRDWAHDMEDCLDRFLPCAACVRKLPIPSFISRRSQFVEEIKRLKGRLNDAHERRRNYNVNDDGRQSVAGSQENKDTDTDTVKPVGMDVPKQELLEMLEADVEGQPHQLKVISIVGFGGSGKTTLASAVFDCLGSQFNCCAWVEAWKHKDDTKGLLSRLLEELLRSAGSESATEAVYSNLEQLKTHIQSYLNAKQRYLIVFDDIEEQQWNCIKSTFPKQARGRIIVTTTIQQVADACSSHGNGYVYSMSALKTDHSKDLLEAILKKKNSPGLSLNSVMIFMDKCDGNPLGLISVANFLLRRRMHSERECQEVCLCLGNHMENDVAFTKLRDVLTRNFISLSGNPLRTCLQYMSVFPNGCPIRRNSLIRRWLAEGYVHYEHPCTDLQAANAYFNQLIDRNIVRPIDSSKCGKVKTCRTHGIMHEFMLRKSKSERFITSLDDDRARSDCRHLFFQRPTNDSPSGSEKEKPRARSLTICGNAGDAVAWFNKCELLRVLDLEECKDVKEDHIKGIHKLWHLKYLSLGGTIEKLPGGFDKLHCLETIDLRKTGVETLPIEIIRLPHLVHLLGKIKLNKPFFRTRRLRSYLSKQSNLQTLAGFVVDKNSAFPRLMAHMKMLRKVKIWCDSTAEGSKIWKQLLKAVHKFVMDGIDTVSDSRSLSLHLGNSLPNFLHSLQDLVLKDHSLEDVPGYLTSLKLHGELTQLPQFVTSLCGLTELCLSSKNLTANELSDLHKLRRLNYLKLVQDDIGGFVIKKGHFPELIHLCFVVENPNLPAIEEGALPKLVSLQLLCQALDGLSGINIKWLKQLEFVSLDSKVNPETIEVWRTEAKNHPRRPKVLFLERIISNNTDSMVKYVAAEPPAIRMGFSQQEIYATPSSYIDASPSSSIGVIRTTRLRLSLCLFCVAICIYLTFYYGNFYY